VTAPTEAYPLSWPMGWKRTPASERKPARFSKQSFVDRGRNAEGQQIGWNTQKPLTVGEGRRRVVRVLEQMGYNKSVVISSNLRLRSDGQIHGRAGEPDDPGVAVYWGRGSEARCIAVDQYERSADNLAAIAATLDAMRAIERHGGAAIQNRAFTRFIALAAPEQWFQVLKVSASATREQITAAHRALAMQHHPDRGGDANQMARINTARDDGLAQAQN
jgi:hypothetical protein